jgi:hypothetical protein
LTELGAQFPAPQSLPDGAPIAPGEFPLLGGNFMLSVVGFFLHTRIVVTNRRLYAVRPNTFFGLIPVGAARSNYPLENIAGVNAATRFSVIGAFVAIVLFFLGVSLLNQPRSSAFGVVLIVLSLLLATNTPRQAIQVMNSGGGAIQFPVSVFERSRTVAFAHAVSEVLARRDVAVSPPEALAAPPAADPASAMAQLNSLRTQGLISEDEFAAKRAQILDRI